MMGYPFDKPAVFPFRLTG